MPSSKDPSCWSENFRSAIFKSDFKKQQFRLGNPIDRLKSVHEFGYSPYKIAAGFLTNMPWKRERSVQENADGNPAFSSILDAFRSLTPAVLASSMIINVLGLALPIVALQIYDRVLTNKSHETLAWLIVSIIVVIVFEAVLKIARGHLMSWAATQEAYRSDMDVVSRILQAPNKKITSENSSIWMDRLDARGEVVAFSTGQSILVLLDLPFIAVFLAIAFLVAGPLAFLIVGIVATFAALTFIKTGKLRTVLEERSEHDHRRYDFITETLMSIEAVKSSAMEPQMLRRFERLQKTSASIMYRKNLISNELSVTSNLMTNVLLISVVSVGAAMVISESISIGALACCTMLTSRLLQPLMRAIPAWIEIENAKIARRKADKLFELPKAHQPTTKASQVHGHISLQGLTFTHEGSRIPVLKDLSLEIAQGEMIGIAADHSIGKSTFLDIVSGELEPQKGKIFVDGIEVKGCLDGTLSRQTVLLRHDADVFRGTILENITMFREGAAISKARAAACLINLERDINRLPQGYDTRLGDGVSETLPPGMLQRIAIARSLSTEPKIVLYDEASSSLDMHSDRDLRNGLLEIKGRLTGIFITSRPSLLEIMDRVFQISDGQLIEVSEQQHIQSHQSDFLLSA